MDTIESILDGEKLLAIIVRNQHHSTGVEFFTKPESSLQLASMGHPKGKKISPHIHRAEIDTRTSFQEVLVVKSGSLRVDLYREDRTLEASRVLYPGDVILLVSGGHGFEVLEDLQMIEVKQGPYSENEDKVRFLP